LHSVELSVCDVGNQVDKQKLILRLYLGRVIG